MKKLFDKYDADPLRYYLPLLALSALIGVIK